MIICTRMISMNSAGSSRGSTLKGERQLRPEDIRFGDDVEEMAGHQLNFYMETLFNVDEV